MYYCKNCGEPYVADEAVMCVRCGAPKGQGISYCHFCGKMVPPDAAACMNCGVACRTMENGAKSKIVAGLLGLFVGCFGVHNFYLGYTTKAVIQLVGTLIGYLLCCVFIGIVPVLGIWIWSFVEAIMIFTGNINRDGKGYPLVD